MYSECLVIPPLPLRKKIRNLFGKTFGFYLIGLHVTTVTGRACASVTMGDLSSRRRTERHGLAWCGNPRRNADPVGGGSRGVR